VAADGAHWVAEAVVGSGTGRWWARCGSQQGDGRGGDVDGSGGGAGAGDDGDDGRSGAAKPHSIRAARTAIRVKWHRPGLGTRRRSERAKGREMVDNGSGVVVAAVAAASKGRAGQDRTGQDGAGPGWQRAGRLAGWLATLRTGRPIRYDGRHSSWAPCPASSCYWQIAGWRLALECCVPFILRPLQQPPRTVSECLPSAVCLCFCHAAILTIVQDRP
jgi:hypothetical protein